MRSGQRVDLLHYSFLSLQNLGLAFLDGPDLRSELVGMR
jgi:hypothetical protein